MAATAALRTGHADRRDQGRLGGNICRCTGCQKISTPSRWRATCRMTACRLRRSTRSTPARATISARTSASTRRQSRRPLRYAGDMVMPGMLHVHICARRTPTRRSFRSTPGRRGDGRRGRHHLRRRAGRRRLRRVRPIAGDGAQQGALCRRGGGRRRGGGPLIARRAAKRSRCLRALPAVFTAEDALSVSAPVIHDYAGQHHHAYPDPRRRHRAGFAESDLVLEENYSTQAIEHAYLGRRRAWDLSITTASPIVSPDQNITHHRHMLAKIIARPIPRSASS